MPVGELQMIERVDIEGSNGHRKGSTISGTWDHGEKGGVGDGREAVWISKEE